MWNIKKDRKGTQMTDEQYMRRAIELAKRGMGYTSPNPMVGAVIVKDGRIIGEGWHERYGELHAERNALKHCKESPRGADNVCDSRALLSSWQAAAMCGGSDRSRYKKSICGLG